MAYSAQQKAQAKALAVAYGNAEEARRLLVQRWEDVPSRQAINVWVRDEAIEPDFEFVTEMAAITKARVVGSISRLLDPLEDAALDALKAGKSLDVLNAVKSWGPAATAIFGVPASSRGYSPQSSAYRPRLVRRLCVKNVA